MKPKNKAFLEANRHHWITLRDAFYVRHLDGNTRSEMQRIMGEEFRPGYTADLWCSVCVADMVRALYQQFEKWEAKQAVIDFHPDIEDLAKKKRELIERWMRENAEKSELPITEPAKTIQPVKANFPSHKNRRR